MQDNRHALLAVMNLCHHRVCLNGEHGIGIEDFTRFPVSPVFIDAGK
jgi:hypothetical protein